MTNNNDVDVERRQSFRLDMEKELIDINWLDVDGKERVKKIACLDFAKGGLKIDCDEEIIESTTITVTFKAKTSYKQVISTKVLRCKKQDNGWFEIALMIPINS